MKEVWVPAANRKDCCVSSNGRFSFRGEILKENVVVNNGGYRTRRCGGDKFMDHRMVWESFNGVIAKGFVINHINGVKTDNRLLNLDICSARDNVIHSIKIGLTKRANSGRMLYTDEEVRAIMFFYSPQKGVGATSSILAKIFDCDRHSISAIAKRKTYSWVK